MYTISMFGSGRSFGSSTKTRLFNYLTALYTDSKNSRGIMLVSREHLVEREADQGLADVNQTFVQIICRPEPHFHRVVVGSTQLTVAFDK